MVDTKMITLTKWYNWLTCSGNCLNNLWTSVYDDDYIIRETIELQNFTMKTHLNMFWLKLCTIHFISHGGTLCFCDVTPCWESLTENKMFTSRLKESFFASIFCRPLCLCHCCEDKKIMKISFWFGEWSIDWNWRIARICFVFESSREFEVRKHQRRELRLNFRENENSEISNKI